MAVVLYTVNVSIKTALSPCWNLRFCLNFRVPRKGNFILNMFAVVDIAGFQEKVSEGDKLSVPTLHAEEGKSVSFDKVLLLAKTDSDIKVGTPYVSGAAVEVRVLSHGKDDKIRVYKIKRRKRYRRTYGHRQGHTNIEIMKIKATGATAASASAKATVDKKAPAAKKETPKKVEKKEAGK